MNIYSNYKIFKYLLKFKNSLIGDNYNKTNKYYNKLKYHILNGGMVDEPELKKN